MIRQKMDIAFSSLLLLFSLSSLLGLAHLEWLPDANPLFNSSSFLASAAIANSLGAVEGNEVEMDGGGGGNKKEEYKVIAKNVTVFIPELHFSTSNGLVELSSINITADFLEVESGKHDTKRFPASAADPDALSMLFEYPELAGSLNRTLSPCDNFYEFVCSGWKQSHPIDEDKTSANQFQQINNLLEERVKAILDDRHGFHSLPPYDEMVFHLYDACMDNASRLEAGSQILLEKLRELKQNRNMRFITDWLVQVWPINLFYQIGIGPDMRNTSSNILTITPNNVFLMSEKLYLEENMAPKYMNALRAYLAQILELLYADDDDKSGGAVFKQSNKAADIQRRVDSFIQVEVEMAKIINATDKHYDNAYADDIYLSLQEFQDTLAGTINWTRYLQNIMPAEIMLKKFPNGIGASEARISEVQLIKKFEQLARNLSGQVLSDYMDWKVILSESAHLDDRYLDVAFELDRVLQGSKERPARWKECKSVAMNVFPALLERVYIKRHMDVKGTRAQMAEMFANVKRSFQAMLDENEWMDERTKGTAFEKLQTLKVLVGYMDTIFNETKLRKHFAEIDIRAGQPFAAIMATLSKLMSQKGMLQLLEPVEVDFSSLTINGFYYPIKNSIVLTGGILQGVFFNSSRPLPMNYGSIGVVLAHEITHGFDNNGRLHDQAGNVRNWWKNETAIAFHEQKQCLIDQYNAISVAGLDGLHINGNMTQGENIADNGGMRAAFNAMKKALEADELAAQRKVQGLEEYSAEQLFFINYAFSWCTNQRPEAAVFGAVYDVHSPPEARVNVVLGNMPQFATHFNCPAGTTMHPAKRCQVW